MAHNIHGISILCKLSALDITSLFFNTCMTCRSRIVYQSMSWENAQRFATTAGHSKLHRQINRGA